MAVFVTFFVGACHIFWVKGAMGTYPGYYGIIEKKLIPVSVHICNARVLSVNSGISRGVLQVLEHPPKAKECVNYLQCLIRYISLASDCSTHKINDCLEVGAPSFIIVSYDINLPTSLRRE